MLYCNTATVATTRRAGAGLSAGWARGASAERAGGRAGACAGGRFRQLGARARGAAGARQAGAGRAVWLLGSGRAGWPGLCTRCTPLGFQPGFLTLYFS